MGKIRSGEISRREETGGGAPPGKEIMPRQRHTHRQGRMFRRGNPFRSGPSQEDRQSQGGALQGHMLHHGITLDSNGGGGLPYQTSPQAFMNQGPAQYRGWPAMHDQGFQRNDRGSQVHGHYERQITQDGYVQNNRPIHWRGVGRGDEESFSEVLEEGRGGFRGEESGATVEGDDEEMRSSSSPPSTV